MIKHTFIVPGILIALMLWGLLSLGFWQLERANEKRVIQSAIIQAQSSPTEMVTQVDVLMQKEHHKVLLKGRYDNSKQFIYDNQIVNHNAGYYVLTPFVLEDKTAILVNRGFIPWQGNRDKLANITVGETKSTIQVMLVKPKERIEFKQHNNTTFPMLIQSLNIDRLSQLSNYQLIPMLAQLDIKSDNGFYRKWQPFYGSVDKHLGYALQWFLMAFVLSFIAIMLLVKNRKTNIT